MHGGGNWIGLIGIMFGCALFALALICGTVLAILKMRNSGRFAKKDGTEADEAQMIQEIYQGLERMEKRVDTLETILMEGRQHGREVP